MKYINAEKLKVLIRQLIGECIRNKWISTEYCLRKILSVIDSLQQEQVSEEHDIAEKFARIVRGHLNELSVGFNAEFERTYLEVTGEKMYQGYTD